jgi:hypothetical protein
MLVQALNHTTSRPIDSDVNSHRCEHLKCYTVQCYSGQTGKGRMRQAPSCSHCCRRKAIRITYCECASASLGVQHAMRMRHIAICGLPHSTIFFPHYLINGTIFGKTSLNTKCVFWFSLQRLFETFLILRRTERDIIKIVCRSACKVPVIFGKLYWNWNFLDKISNIKFHEDPSSGSRVVRHEKTDRRTYMTNLIVSLRKFTYAQ